MQSSFAINGAGASIGEEFGAPYSIWDRIRDAPLEPLKDPSRRSRLLFRIQAGPECPLRLSTGERLADLKGALGIVRLEGQYKASLGVGFVTMLESDSYVIEVALPQEQFADLASRASAGRFPTVVTIDTRGPLTDQAWDAKAETHLPVASITFTIPLSASVVLTSQPLLAALAKHARVVIWLVVALLLVNVVALLLASNLGQHALNRL
jgi:hypothetical protein